MRIKQLLSIILLFAILSGCIDDQPYPQKLTPKTVVSILFGQSNSDPGLEDMLTEKIAKGFPDVSLEWESMDWGDYFSSEMQAKIASGEVPDLMIGKAQDVPAYQPSGYLAAFDKSLCQQIDERTLSSVTVDGAVYGLPYNACYQGVIYNKNIFWRYGLKIPTTLEEMDSLIHRLKEVGATPFASHFRESWYAGNIAMQFAANQVFLKNPSWGDEFRAGLHSFDESEEYSSCLRQIETIYQNSWPDAMTVDQYECAMRFSKDEAAMYLTGTWSLQSLFALRPDMQIGIFPYPNRDGNARLLFEPNLTFMKNNHSPHQELLDDILNFILEDEELARTSCAFTQTESLLRGIHTDSMTQLRDSINLYTKENLTMDVTIGNRQMVWEYQGACAAKVYDWLEDKISFEDVIRFANQNRSQSG